MEKSYLTITLELAIYDETAFRTAARDYAIRVDNYDPKEAADFLDPAQMSLADCAQMLFDPSEGPPGCDIEQSSASDESVIVSRIAASNQVGLVKGRKA